MANSDTQPRGCVFIFAYCNIIKDSHEFQVRVYLEAEKFLVNDIASFLAALFLRYITLFVNLPHSPFPE